MEPGRSAHGARRSGASGCSRPRVGPVFLRPNYVRIAA
uniref:Uncharacterized protein n=1 Tax=Anguilla anguilla TaxID=7936 RepID=A0A0E9V9Z6_ANGAN